MLTLLFIITLLVLGFWGAPFFCWGVWLLALEFTTLHVPVLIWWASLLIVFVGSIRPLRKALVTGPMLTLLKKLNIMPSISETEKQAIEAGGAWVEKEFFSGKPNIETLMKQPTPTLTPEEQSFMDHQLVTLCDMIDDWKIWKERDVPEAVFDYIKKEKFLGLIIPKQYGGLEFSPYAHSEVIKRLASRSFVVAIYVMVPNSLGPAELLIHYGTDEQKRTLLPKLAIGQEIPCFALTEVTAGSDAGNVQAEGVLFMKDGVLYIRFNWHKRYITLACMSTVLGIAFHLKDPENLLGKGKDLGITCALIPSSLPGIDITKRHDPLGVPFYNCPTIGINVEAPASSIVGGIEQAGKGWVMLMECLAAGRGISFPAQMAGSSELVSHLVSSYAVVRQQFGVSIGRFEGVQELLSRVIGLTYLVDALRKYTLSSLQQGVKPAVISSISKYYSTENSRKLLNDAMDLMGGAAISLGPKNKIAHYYIGSPLCITVEGANVLTRCLMIFGQGAFRAHPYAFQEITALEKGDVDAFDLNFWAHMGSVVRNIFRSVLLSVTRGWLAHPFDFSREAKYIRKISWASASFAVMADFSMGTLGGKLKFKESLTGRLSDIVSYLYISSAILHKFKSDGSKDEDWPMAEYALEYSFSEMQIAFEKTFLNFRVPYLSWIYSGPLYAWCKVNPLSKTPSDALVTEVSRIAMEEPETIDRLSYGIYLPKDPQDHLITLRRAADLFRKIEPTQKTIQKELRARKMKGVKPEVYLPLFANEKLISADEVKLVEEWNKVRLEVVAVDEFSEEEYH